MSDRGGVERGEDFVFPARRDQGPIARSLGPDRSWKSLLSPSRVGPAGFCSLRSLRRFYEAKAMTIGTLNPLADLAERGVHARAANRADDDHVLRLGFDLGRWRRKQVGIDELIWLEIATLHGRRCNGCLRTRLGGTGWLPGRRWWRAMSRLSRGSRGRKSGRHDGFFFGVRRLGSLWAGGGRSDLLRWSRRLGGNDRLRCGGTLSFGHWTFDLPQAESLPTFGTVHRRSGRQGRRLMAPAVRAGDFRWRVARGHQRVCQNA